MDNIRPAKPVKGLPIPEDVQEKIGRGRKEMLRDASRRRLCQRFERGDTYWFLNDKTILSEQPTVTSANGGGKPPHRIRSKVNFIRPVIEAKVSAATQRVPSYDVSPSTNDPAKEGAARMSEAVAFYGYDKWRLRRVSIKVCKLAIGGGGDGFALPYFDPNVGPFTPVDGEQVGAGEIKVLVLSGNEVFWETGCDFNDSPWHGVEQARPIDAVEQMPGFIKGLKLAPDATTSDIPTDREDRDNLVMVTDFYERPCPKYPEGRVLHFAQGQLITDHRQTDPTSEYPWEPYPLRDHEGLVVDEPVLHRLSYTVDPETDRDLGLTWQLIDVQRTLQDCWNKALEHKNRVLHPQMSAPVGSLIDRPDDVPGAVRYYRPIGGLKPEWETHPPVPDSLFRIFDLARTAMREIGADVNIDNTDAAARTLQQVIEQSNNRWQTFLGDLAEFHGRLMRHCLLLVARHYTEPRLLQIKGRNGPYSIEDFQGAQLMGQVDVTVLPGSLEVKSRTQIRDEVLAYADRGWVSPQVAMAAINGGNAEKLIQGFELDMARANRIIQAIVKGTVMDLGTWVTTDPISGESVEQPIYMPTESDNTDIWKTVFADFRKTEAYSALAPEMQEATNLIYSGILAHEAAEQQRQMMAEAAKAAQLGMSNASRPTTTGTPSMPGSTGTPLPNELTQ